MVKNNSIIIFLIIDSRESCNHVLLDHFGNCNSVGFNETQSRQSESYTFIFGCSWKPHVKIWEQRSEAEPNRQIMMMMLVSAFLSLLIHWTKSALPPLWSSHHRSVVSLSLSWWLLNFPSICICWPGEHVIKITRQCNLNMRLMILDFDVVLVQVVRVQPSSWVSNFFHARLPNRCTKYMQSQCKTRHKTPPPGFVIKKMLVFAFF